MAMTLDGKVMRPDGTWRGLTGSEDRRRMDVLRIANDVLIVGKNSIINDDPDVIPKHASGRPPLPVMICRTLPPVDRKIFRQTIRRPLVFLTKRLSEKVSADLDALGAAADLVFLDDSEMLPESILERLGAMGHNTALLEGGPRLNYSFFQADLVDSLFLTVVPHIIGQRDLPAIVDGIGAMDSFDLKKWRLDTLDFVGSEIYLKYERNRGNHISI